MQVADIPRTAPIRYRGEGPLCTIELTCELARRSIICLRRKRFLEEKSRSCDQDHPRSNELKEGRMKELEFRWKENLMVERGMEGTCWSQMNTA